LEHRSHLLAPLISYRPRPLVTRRTGCLFASLLLARSWLTMPHPREVMRYGAPHSSGHQLHFLL